MRTVVDERLRNEVDRFRLRYTCDDCAHFAGHCIHEYPTAPHRLTVLTSHEVVFCKEFELE